MNIKKLLGLFCGSLLLAGALPAEQDFLSEDALYGDDVETVAVSDPFESVNRVTFHFNDFVIKNLLTPVANTYVWVTPDSVQTGAHNFFRNLRFPVRLAGNVLQGRVKGAWVETRRFAVNTTAGLGGVLNPADSVEGLERIPLEDVGQAFGSWGIGEGPYIVIPFMGPSNLRDLAGRFGDLAVHPMQQPFRWADVLRWEWDTALTVGEFIEASPALVKRYQDLKGSSVDPYSAMKAGYTQARRAAIER